MDKNQLITKVREIHQSLIGLATGKITENFYEKYERVRAELLQLDQGILSAIPRWIYENKYGSNFWQYVKRISPHYQPRRDFINESFDDLYNFIEKGADQPISLSLDQINRAIKNEYIDLLWKKIYSRKSFDRDGAVTACKTLIETTLKHLLDSKNVEYSSRDDMGSLYKKVSKNYGLEPDKKKHQEFHKLCVGCITVVSGISEIRNKYGDAHGKGDQQKVSELTQNYVDVMVNMTGSIVTFLLSFSEGVDGMGQGE
jgi:hypothetical protein